MAEPTMLAANTLLGNIIESPPDGARGIPLSFEAARFLSIGASERSFKRCSRHDRLPFSAHPSTVGDAGFRRPVWFATTEPRACVLGDFSSRGLPSALKVQMRRSGGGPPSVSNV